ncbi:2-phosphosulfolactate phosphatase [Solibacillus sp. CAU 1738]|uniref:2-phosphosulfolactate phosphatase n=1 Tax=Solibacillus sp. CAU 1738 TaxID=3140363 RepID=UPI00325FE531
MLYHSPYICNVEWGLRGAREAAERGDIIIIVDVLSFSSTVVTALSHGAVIYPYPPHLNGKQFAEQIDAEFILGRAEAAKLNKPTLSPISYSQEHANKKYVLSSLNGAMCTWAVSKVPALLIGSLLNASSVSSVVNQLRMQLNANITVVPCGEQWNDVRENENSLRPSIEDYLGAGAILSKLDGEKSPESDVCIGAFQHAKQKISEIIWECESGRELRNRGYEEDVRHCSRLDVFQTIPLLKSDHFVSVQL